MFTTKRFRTRPCLLVIMPLVLLAAGCGGDKKKPQEKIVNVRAVKVEKKMLRPYVETVGSLKPIEEVVISSEIDGVLKRVTVIEGSAVGRGTVVAEVNDIDYRLGLRQAEAALKQARANMANAKQEHERKEALYKEQLVTRQQYDDIVARLAVADGEVDRAKATLDLAREKLAKTRIVSPLAGSVKEKRVYAGDYVRNGTALMTVIATNPMKLLFTVVEREAGKLKIGQDVVFRVDSLPGKDFQGRLKTIYPSLEERTRSLQAEALVSNGDGVLKPGLFARVTLYTEQARERIIIPITSLLYEGTGVKVYLVEGGKAKERIVKVGQKFDEFMEVTEGLQGGEELVVAGQNNLSDGVTVNVAR